jgi:hypothetical protein
VTTPSRNNGLPAERWAPLVDLEPQLADALLEALREEGVAAYVSPAPGVRGPYMDIQLPNTPTDRVWVDAGATAAARQVLDSRRAEFNPSEDRAETQSQPPAPVTPAEPDEQDFDAAFRAIVAGYGKTGTEQVAPWSPAEDVENDAPTAGGSWRVLRRADDDRTDPEDDGWGVPSDAGSETAEATEPAEPEEHYVPPPPPPLPRMDKHTKLAWAGVIGGPIFLILFTSLDWSPIPGATFLAIAAFVGGFASLVYRMKDDGPNHGDDGAVV